MTRIEELTLKLLEGMISEEEINELEWTVASDKAAAQKHLALLELESSLRGLRTNVDVVGRVMGGVMDGPAEAKPAAPADPLEAMAQAADPTVEPDAPLPEIFDTQPAEPNRPPHRRRSRRRKGLPPIIYVLLLLSAALVIAAYFIRKELQTPPPVPINQARVVAAEGPFNVIRDKTTYKGEVGSLLNPGNVIRTSPGSVVTFEYDPAHVVKLFAEAEVRIEGTQPGVAPQARAIVVRQGSLELTALADTDRPHIAVSTPHARIAAAAARYDLAVGGKRTTLEVYRGRVEMTRSLDNAVLQAGGNERIIVETGLPLVATPIDAGPRVTEGLLLLYRFAEGGGKVVRDVSGVEPSVDLNIASTDSVLWGNRSLRIIQSTTIATDRSNAKLIEAIRSGDGLTIEAWLEPANVEQNGPATILTLGSDPFARNVTLGQGIEPDAGGHGDRYTVRYRTMETEGDGKPGLQTNDNAAKPQLTHLVFTRQANGASHFYINGKLDREGRLEGDLANWATDTPLVLGNEATGDRPWLGELRLVALYNRALTAEQVAQHFTVNVVGPLPTDEQPMTKPAGPDGNWKEATYFRMTGSDRSPEFKITTSRFRLRIRCTQPDEASGQIVVRLRDYRDASRAQELVSTDEPKLLMTVPAQFGEGEYIIETLGPDMTDWEIQVEQAAE
jgi:hypothetical protein